MTVQSTPDVHAASAPERERAGKHRVLGWGILAYVVLTSGALLTIAQGWVGALNSALWLTYAAGGVGFVRGRSWGRAFTLVAAGGSLATLFLLRWAPWTEVVKLAYFMTVWGFFGVPALAVLVAAILVRTPAAAETAATPRGVRRAWTRARPRKRVLCTLAYASFTTLGLIAAWSSFLAYIFRHDDVPAALGFGVGVPLVLPLMAALVLGPGLSLFLWRDLRLIAFMALSIALLIAVNSLPDEILWVPLALYAAACLPLCVDWFVRGRKQLG